MHKLNERAGISEDLYHIYEYIVSLIDDIKNKHKDIVESDFETFKNILLKEYPDICVEEIPEFIHNYNNLESVYILLKYSNINISAKYSSIVNQTHDVKRYDEMFPNELLEQCKNYIYSIKNNISMNKDMTFIDLSKHLDKIIEDYTDGKYTFNDILDIFFGKHIDIYNDEDNLKYYSKKIDDPTYSKGMFSSILDYINRLISYNDVNMFSNDVFGIVEITKEPTISFDYGHCNNESLLLIIDIAYYILFTKKFKNTLIHELRHSYEKDNKDYEYQLVDIDDDKSVWDVLYAFSPNEVSARRSEISLNFKEIDEYIEKWLCESDSGLEIWCVLKHMDDADINDNIEELYENFIGYALQCLKNSKDMHIEYVMDDLDYYNTYDWMDNPDNLYYKLYYYWKTHKYIKSLSPKVEDIERDYPLYIYDLYMKKLRSIYKKTYKYAYMLFHDNITIELFSSKLNHFLNYKSTDEPLVMCAVKLLNDIYVDLKEYFKLFTKKIIEFFPNTHNKEIIKRTISDIMYIYNHPDEYEENIKIEDFYDEDDIIRVYRYIM